MHRGQRSAMMISRVPPSALSDLHPAVRLAGPARPLARLQERGVAGAAARGRRAAPHQSAAPPGLGRPRCARRADPVVPKTCATWADALGIARFGQAARRRPGRSWLGRRWDSLRLMGLRLVFLVVSRVMSLLRLSRRESWWKDAEILMLRHQLAVAERERPKARARLTWPDRAL